jgi:hypothetical protein
VALGFVAVLGARLRLMDGRESDASSADADGFSESAASDGEDSLLVLVAVSVSA